MSYLHSKVGCNTFERDVEFPQLRDSVYVDHAGATLYSKTQLEAFQGELLGNLYGNPHSRNQSSRLATDAIDQIRYRILAHFNTTSTEYSVVFTSGCTGALKLVAECFDFNGSINSNSPNSYKKWNNVGVTSPENNKCCSLIGQSNDTCMKDDSENNKCCSLIGQSNGTCKKEDSEKNSRETSCMEQLATEQKCDLQSKFKGKSGCFAYLMDNHTSVQGMREVVKSRVSHLICVDEVSEENFTAHYLLGEFQGDGQSIDQLSELSLFAYPAQSNFSGKKYPLHWIEKIHQGQMSFQRSVPGKWLVLLDAASYVSTSNLDLKLYKPDFVTLSFYKMFGFPTGIGALLVRNKSASVLKKIYFGGGTVGVSSPTELYHVQHPSMTDRFEDGTVPFLDIIALRHGFDALNNLGGGMKSISSHSFSVAQYFYNCLKGLQHSNSNKVAEIYCHGDFTNQSTQSPIVNFNLKRLDGSYVGFAEVDKMAQLYNIHLRTGCFCNIGACQKYLNMSSEQIKTNFEAGHVCGDDKDLIDGQPTGSVRISFGYMSTMDDGRQCLKFICDCFVENDNKPDFSEKIKSNANKVDKASESVIDHETENYDSTSIKSKICLNNGIDVSQEENRYLKEDGHLQEQSGWPIMSLSDLHIVLQQCSSTNRILTNICLYPVKSCGAFQVTSWEICETGLLYDREWMVVSDSGVTISQKREPKLCLIKPHIDLNYQQLKLCFPGVSPVTVSLDISGQGHQTMLPCVGKVCGDRVLGRDCGDEVGQWISNVLQRPGCRLIRQDKTQTRTCKLVETDMKPTLSLVNESQYLLISRRSVEELKTRILEQGKGSTFELDNLIERFRANLVIGGGQPFDEESWQNILIGNNSFMSQGGCSRCQMVCLDQMTGERSKEPLKTLAAWRGKKIPFGIHLQHSGSTIGGKVKVGDVLTIE